MSNTKELLLLQLTHAKQALEKAKNNSYSDQRKEVYQKKLSDLFDALEKDVIAKLATYSDAEIYTGPQIHLHFIVKSLQFLDSSTLNQIPYEIVECLKHAMDEWEKTADKFIIVTSLINDAEGFSYESWPAIDDNLHNDLHAKYPAINFDYRLVQINLPKALVRDYLIAVVLYHELAHFIDIKSSIMYSLLLDVLDKIYTNSFSVPEKDELKVFFPDLQAYIDNPSRPHWNAILSSFRSTLSHFQEYFSDLFAAQYIGDKCNLYVTYLGQNQTQHSPTHPSDINRQKVVSDFISGTANFVLGLIKSSVQKIKGLSLQKRYSDIPSTAFFNLVPTDLKSIGEVHGIFSAAWNIWLNDQDKLAANLNANDPSKIYSVLNNLIEKSIGNYISRKEWEKVNPGGAVNSVKASQNIVSSFFALKRKGILTRSDILELFNKNRIVVSPLLNPDQVGEAGIDFRLGYDFLVSIQGRDAFINASKNEWVQGGQQRNVKQFFQSSRRQLGETFILHPNQTVLAVTLEYVRLPEDCMLMLFMRSSYARLGLTISTIVQPGYCGCLSLEFTNNNNNPINLAIGARIIQGVICRVSNPTTYFHTSRKYICQVRPESSAVINDHDLTVLNELWKQNNQRP